MANPVGWFEVSGPDAGALQRFYREAFGWEIDANNPMSYGMVAAQEGGIGGGVCLSPDGEPYVVFYIAVPDLQAALDQIGRLGGATVTPPMDVPGGPSIAFFNDPAGNRIGLMKPM
jgi:predicted enzyme related to lactoylglutathione lyase